MDGQQTFVPALDYRGRVRTAKIPSCSVSLGDLRRLYAQLSEKTREALDRHLATLHRPPNQTDEQFAAAKIEAQKVGTLTVMVVGADGKQILSTSSETLNDERLPDIINSITFDSSAALQTYNISLPNRFRLTLDFTETPFYGYNPWDQPTPNNSLLEVVGSDMTWAIGVYESVLAFFKSRRKARGWLHNQTTFNALNWIIGFPGALWIVYRLDR